MATSVGPIPTWQPDTETAMTSPIKRGDRVRIKPEWQDPGDDKLTWVAIENENGGRVRIAPVMPDMSYPPNYVVTIDMLEPTQ